MELELRSVELQGAHVGGGAARGAGAPPPPHPGQGGGPLGLFLSLVFFFYSQKNSRQGRNKNREKDPSRFMIRGRRQALISLGRDDLDSVRGSGEGNPLPSSSSTFITNFMMLTAVRE